MTLLHTVQVTYHVQDWDPNGDTCHRTHDIGHNWYTSTGSILLAYILEIHMWFIDQTPIMTLGTLCILYRWHTQDPFVSCVLLSWARCVYNIVLAYILEIHTCGPPCRWLLSGSGGCQCDFLGCLLWAQLEPTCVCLFMAQLRVMAMVNIWGYMIKVYGCHGHVRAPFYYYDVNGFWFTFWVMGTYGNLMYCWCITHVVHMHGQNVH